MAIRTERTQGLVANGRIAAREGPWHVTGRAVQLDVVLIECEARIAVVVESQPSPWLVAARAVRGTVLNELAHVRIPMAFDARSTTRSP